MVALDRLARSAQSTTQTGLWTAEGYRRFAPNRSLTPLDPRTSAPRDPNGHPVASSHAMHAGGNPEPESKKHVTRGSEPDADAAKHRDRCGQCDEPGIGGVSHSRKRGFCHIAENAEGRVIVVEQVLDDGKQLDVLGDLIG